MSRQQLLEQLVKRIIAIDFPHPVRVAIDGIDAAGKTTLADDLAPLLEAAGRPVIRASLDGFHRPRSERYRRGAESPEGYYEDAFDYQALQAALLLPLGPAGNRRYRRAVFDFRQDTPLLAKVEIAPARAVLLFDGVFLLRPELAGIWDYRIFVKVAFDVALQRALQRDQALFGSAEAVWQRYRQRYIPAQRFYLETIRPEEQADVVVGNDDPLHPLLIANRAGHL